MNNEYFCGFAHKIVYILSQSDFVLNYIDTIIKIATGVIAIIGLRYIKPLKDKTLGATFNFWSQLKVRLIRIEVRLEADKGILKNIYAKTDRDSVESLAPDINRVKELKNDIEDTIDFIRKTPDQMPAYQGWSKDYFSLLFMLEECIVYDICDNERHFKKILNYEDKIDYRNEMCNLINKICKGIDERQNKLEKQIIK